MFKNKFASVEFRFSEHGCEKVTGLDMRQLQLEIDTLRSQ